MEQAGGGLKRGWVSGSHSFPALLVLDNPGMLAVGAQDGQVARVQHRGIMKGCLSQTNGVHSSSSTGPAYPLFSGFQMEK